MLLLNIFSKSAKIAISKANFKNKDRANIENYRPVSILNYERFLYNQLTAYVDKISSNFTAAYRKGYSTSNVLIRLIENWKKAPHNILLAGAVLTLWAFTRSKSTIETLEQGVKYV